MHICLLRSDMDCKDKERTCITEAQNGDMVDFEKPLWETINVSNFSFIPAQNASFPRYCVFFSVHYPCG